MYVIFRGTWAIDILDAAEASTADTAVLLKSLWVVALL